LGETPVGRYVEQGMSTQHQQYVKELQDLEKALQEAHQNEDESTLSQLKEKHDQQRNLIQKLEIGRQGLNMKLAQLTERKISELDLPLESESYPSQQAESELLLLLRAKLPELHREMEEEYELIRLECSEQTRAIAEGTIQQLSFEISRHSLAVCFFQSRLRAWRSFRLLKFFNCISNQN
jgi:hypothetical protein